MSPVATLRRNPLASSDRADAAQLRRPKLIPPDEQAVPEPTLDTIREAEAVRSRRLLALGLAAVAALFSGVVIGVMAVTWVEERAQTTLDPKSGERRPPESHALRVLKSEIGEGRGKLREILREAIREEDLRVRARFRIYRRRLYWGAFLLLVGVAGLVASARWYASLDPKAPMPVPLAERPDPEAWARNQRRGLTAVAALAALAVVFLVIGAFERSRLPTPDDLAAAAAPDSSQPTTAAPSTAPPTLSVDLRAGFKDDWPRFRGPTGMGVVPKGDWPIEWDGTSGKNVVWKSAVPPEGKGSPVLWGNLIFLTAGSEEKLEVLCYERKTGRLLWQTPVPSPLLEDVRKKRAKLKPGDEAEDELFRVFESTGYAAATAATDGQRVFAVFATGDVAALDLAGRILWRRQLGNPGNPKHDIPPSLAPDNSYGMASSLVVHKGLVILQHDQGGDPEDELSALIALDAKTGKTVWRTVRPVPNSWATPIIVDTGSRTEIIAVADPWAIGYDPDTGAELWRAEGVSGDVAPSPIFAGGLIFLTNQYARVIVIRAGGKGDVTKTHTLWVAEEGMSDAACPVTDGKLFVQADSGGFITCYDARKSDPPGEGMKWPQGKLLWEKELDRTVFWASPTLVGDRVYLTAKSGKTYIFPLTPTKPQFQATGPLFEQPKKGESRDDEGRKNSEELFASPAFGDGFIYFRTSKQLICIGKKQP